MSVKSDVRRTLEEHRGAFFSGEELASQIGVSRAAVWKAIKQLREEGYQIEAIPNKGYCLAMNNDIISEMGIRTHLDPQYESIPIIVKKETGSTNQDAKTGVVEGKPHGTVYVTDKQTAGRGRRGRSFVSMNGNSIYMSMILKPEVSAENVVLITTAASVAVNRAIYQVTGKQTQIKWVNDLYYNQRKICGILTEAVTDCETGTIDRVILGIGINFNIVPESVPEELKEVAGALFAGNSGNITRNQLIAKIIQQVMNMCKNLGGKEFLDDYRRNSMVIGKTVNVIGTVTKEAIAIGIAENGGLMVRYLDGNEETLCSGEITIRIQ